MYFENLCGCGPGFFLPPQPHIRDSHVDVREVIIGLPLERFFKLFDRFLRLPRVAMLSPAKKGPTPHRNMDPLAGFLQTVTSPK